MTKAGLVLPYFASGTTRMDAVGRRQSSVRGQRRFLWVWRGSFIKWTLDHITARSREGDDCQEAAEIAGREQDGHPSFEILSGTYLERSVPSPKASHSPCQ